MAVSTLELGKTTCDNIKVFFKQPTDQSTMDHGKKTREKEKAN